MNEEITQRLVKYLDALEAGAIKGGEFIGEQAPEVCREIVAWHVANGVVNVAACLAVVLVIWIARYAISRIVRATAPSKEDGLLAVCLVTLIACVATVPAAVIAVKSSKEAVKAIYAPRLVIIEEIRKNIP